MKQKLVSLDDLTREERAEYGAKVLQWVFIILLSYLIFSVLCSAFAATGILRGNPPDYVWYIHWPLQIFRLL